MKLFEIPDKDGHITAVSKLEYLQTELEEFLNTLSFEKQTNDTRKKPLPIDFNTRIYNKLETVMLKAERPMPNSEALNLTADNFYQFYNEYCDLCCYIETKMSISYRKNKAEFCNYCAITVDAFDNTKQYGEVYVKEALSDIDGKIANGILISAENNEIKAKPAEFHLSAKSSIGHRIQTVNSKEPILVLPTSENDFRPLSEIIPPKYIEDKKAKTKRKTN